MLIAESPGTSFPWLLRPIRSWIVRPPPYGVIASGSRLVIYAQFGGKSEDACAGGLIVADPLTGAVTDRLGSDMRFRQILASSDGQYRYGLDVGYPAWQRVRLVKMETNTGQVVAERNVDSDVWYLAAGQIPHDMPLQTHQW